eukprot:scaffold14896_cov55-Phaeocystis_antarctica.AAC.1
MVPRYRTAPPAWWHHPFVLAPRGSFPANLTASLAQSLPMLEGDYYAEATRPWRDVDRTGDPSGRRREPRAPHARRLRCLPAGQRATHRLGPAAGARQRARARLCRERAAARSKCSLGSAAARILRLLGARLSALGSSALPGRGRPIERPATAVDTPGTGDSLQPLVAPGARGALLRGEYGRDSLVRVRVRVRAPNPNPNQAATCKLRPRWPGCQRGRSGWLAEAGRSSGQPGA